MIWNLVCQTTTGMYFLAFYVTTRRVSRFRTLPRDVELTPNKALAGLEPDSFHTGTVNIVYGKGLSLQHMLSLNVLFLRRQNPDTTRILSYNYTKAYFLNKQ